MRKAYEKIGTTVEQHARIVKLKEDLHERGLIKKDTIPAAFDWAMEAAEEKAGLRSEDATTF